MSSFQSHVGLRGVHVYSSDDCKFLPWNDVISYINKMPKSTDPEFSEKLLGTLANYDPDEQFLAIQKSGDTISIELYAKQD